MSVKVDFGISEATINNYHWTSEDKDLEQLLNTMLDPLGPSGDDPTPDIHAAEAAIEQLGGEIVSVDKLPKFVEGRVY